MVKWCLFSLLFLSLSLRRHRAITTIPHLPEFSPCWNRREGTSRFRRGKAIVCFICPIIQREREPVRVLSESRLRRRHRVDGNASPVYFSTIDSAGAEERAHQTVTPYSAPSVGRECHLVRAHAEPGTLSRFPIPRKG